MGAIDLFADVKDVSANIATYRGVLRCRSLIVGGIPSSPSVIEAWLRARLRDSNGQKASDIAIEEMLARTIEERKDKGEVAAFENTDEMISAVLADENLRPSINGFKRDDDNVLCYESRAMKAALKEAMNSAFPGTDWTRKPRTDADKEARPLATKYNPPRKGLLSTAAERVFVRGDFLRLQHEVDGQLTPITAADISATAGEGVAWVEERIKHVQTQQGPRSSVNKVEVVRRPTIAFEVGVHDDFLAREDWARVWLRLEDLGVGADRGRSDGQFDLLEWEKVS